MGTTTTNGTITSFGNTPQAVDDSYTYTEDFVSSAVWLNVMSNDLGGNAKTLYSIDGGTSDSNNDGLDDLLSKDVAGIDEFSNLGATITIGTDPSDGKMKVSYDAGTLFQSLGAGESATDTFRYAIRLGNGTLSWATVTVHITGTNDAPVITGVKHGSVTEDAQGHGSGSETANGCVTFTDVDSNDHHTASVTPQGAGYLGTFTLDPITHDSTGGVTGSVDWHFTVTDGVLDHLAEGQTLTQKYDVTVSDGHGGVVTQVVNITIHGTNDAPVITSAAQGGDVSEGDGQPVSSMSASGKVTYTDVDTSDSHTLSVSIAAAHGTATVDPDGTWHYTVSDSGAVDALGVNDSLPDSFTVQVDDGHGGIVTQVVNITIHGTNDAPVVDLNGASPGNDNTAAFTEQTPVLIAPSAVISDIDSTNLASMTVTLTARPDGNATESLALNAAAAAAATAAGLTVTYTATTGVLLITGSATQATYQTVLEGVRYNDASDTPNTSNRSVTVVVSDGTASSTSHSITIGVTPVNDAPVIDLNGAAAGTSATLSYLANGAPTAISPSAAVSDVDSADFNGGSLKVSFTTNGTNADQLMIQNQGTGAGQIGVTGSNVTYGGVIIGTFSGGTNGSDLIITFNSATATQAAVQALTDHILYSNSSANPSTSPRTVTFTVNDGDGGASTGSATATINVTAANSAPVVDLNGAATGNDTTVNYPTGVSQLLIASSATISDVDSANLASMTITLTNSKDKNGSIPAEILSLNAAATAAASGLGVTYDPSTGVLSISGSASVATYQSILQGVQYSDTKSPGNHNQTQRIVTVVVSDGVDPSISHTVFINVAQPAGIAGEPINLALVVPELAQGTPITVKVSGVPTDWTLNQGTNLGNGTWLVQQADLASLEVTTASTYAGALVLNVEETWTNADGTTGRAIVADNVEAYAAGSPIFAWSGDDTLSGSAGKDTFVFANPIGKDVVHHFDVGADQIDLVGFGITDFASLQGHIANDGHGNAVITLGDGETITIDGIDAGQLTADNFAFDQEPVLHNAGMLAISDGAMMPVSGIVDNTGVIQLNSTGSETDLEIIQHGATLQGGGQVVLSDDSHN
ncbi:MAG TPA: VCBS domain-containing protein, partial [Dongiaceae bacterium]|nr:VCBS domain-containing protein [Dongiaceae bacterium]